MIKDMSSKYTLLLVVIMIVMLTGCDESTNVMAQDIIQKDMAELQKLALGSPQKVELTDEFLYKIKSQKSFLLDGINAYNKFRESLMTVIKLESFIDFFGRQGNCCSDQTGIRQSLSGYYEGQWRLLDSNPSLQAFMSSQEESNSTDQQQQSSFRRTQWYTNYFGHQKVSEVYKNEQLGKLGSDFVSRGYSQGKVNFAILFDEVIQDNGMSNQVIERSFMRKTSNQLKNQQNINQTALKMQAQQLRKDVIIAQFLNHDFSGQNQRNLFNMRTQFEAKFEQEIFGPAKEKQMGLFEYITDDLNERKAEMNNYVSQTLIEPILQKSMQSNQSGSHMTIENVTLDTIVSKLHHGELKQGEMMYFINNLRNKAAHIKGSIFANDQHSDEQLQIEISLNSKYDGLNSTKDIEFQEFQGGEPITNRNQTRFPDMSDPRNHPITSQLKISNVRVLLNRVKNFWEKKTYTCYINMTLDTMIDAQKEAAPNANDKEYLMKNPYKNSVLLNADQAKLLQVRLLLESAEEESDCFPKRVQIDLKNRNIAKTQTKTVYFTMVLLIILIIGMGTCLKQLKRILTNYQAAQQLSLFSLAILVIWHFCLFWQHFVFFNIGASFDFLKFPGCAYFLHSFVFEMRLLQEAFKVHYQYLMMDPQALKRKLLIFYLGIYLGFIVFFIYQDIFLYDTTILLVSSGTLWIPQIVHNYKRNSRNNHPYMSFYISQTASQVFVSVYMYGCPHNFFEKQTDLTFVIVFIGFLVLQLVILYYQQKLGCRFFIPLALRRDPNAYNYYFNFSNSRRGANDPERAEYQAEEQIECVICMNKIIWEVDRDGNPIEEERPQIQPGQSLPKSSNNISQEVELQSLPNSSLQQLNTQRSQDQLQTGDLVSQSNQAENDYVPLSTTGRSEEGSCSPQKQGNQLMDTTTEEVSHEVVQMTTSTENESNTNQQNTEQRLSNLSDLDGQSQNENSNQESALASGVRPAESNPGGGQAAVAGAPEDQIVYKRAKLFMRTPCGHRYHPHCLKKWMEIRLECPFCRQAIPPLDE